MKCSADGCQTPKPILDRFIVAGSRRRRRRHGRDRRRGFFLGRPRGNRVNPGNPTSMDWFNGYFLSNPNVSWENSMVPCGFPLDGLMSPICTQVFRWTNHPGDTITGEERDDGERVLDDGRERRDHHQVGCLRSSNMACWTFPHLVQWCYHANLHLVQEMSQLAMFDDTRGYHIRVL